MESEVSELEMVLQGFGLAFKFSVRLSVLCRVF